MSNLLYKIFTLFSKHRSLALVSLLLFFVSLSFIASKINFEEDILKLVPKTAQSVEIKKVIENTNFSDKIIFKITKRDSVTIDELTSYASVLVDSLKRNKYVNKVEGIVDNDNIFKVTDYVHKNLPLFLDKEDYSTILEKIKKENLENTIHKNYRTLISPTGSIVKKQILRDPLGLTFLALKKLQKLGVGDNLVLKNGFLTSKDEKNVLLFVDTKFPPSETEKNTVLVNQLKQTIDQLFEKYSNIEVSYFGAAVVAVENAKQIKKDIQITISIALTILLIILISFYRKISIPVILFIPTLFGGVLAISFLTIFRDNVSVISLGIGSVLLGITLDYSLHILSYIKKERSVQKLYDEISKPVLVSSLTTASAFLCLLFIDSQALQDLGIFASVSVVGASLFALLFIPHVYKFKESNKEKKSFFDAFLNFDMHRNKWLVGIVFGLILTGALNYENVIFDKDLSKLNYKSIRLQKVENSLNELTNISEKSVYLISYGNEIDSVLMTNESLLDKLSSYEKDDEIIEVKSVSSLVSSTKKQLNKIEFWKTFWNSSKINSLEENLQGFGGEVGFKPETFSTFISTLNKKYTPVDFLHDEGISFLPVKEYINEKNDFVTTTNIVKLKEEHIDKFRKEFNNISNVYLVDRKEMNEVFLGGLKSNFSSLMLWSFLVVLLLLLVFYQNIYLTLVTLIPVALTWIITVGLMGVFNINFNIFNIIISSFIFGLGIDYSIFITSALQKEYTTGNKYLSNYKSAITLSVITTVLGVGVLIFAKHPVLYSISAVSIIGVFSAVFLAFTLQPILFKLLIGSKKRESIKVFHLFFSILSFTYFGLGGVILSLFSATIMKVIPISKKLKMKWFHITVSKFMDSVLWSYPFLRNKVINQTNEDFTKRALIIANHNSFLDILTIGKLHPKIIFLVNDWVYNSPIFGKAVQLAGFYPVSKGIDKGLGHLEEKIKQGYSLMVFPEGTRSETNKMKRFHKGAFYLADQFKLDIVPVLIHGASEILPKGNFIMKKGTITAKILKRISFEDNFYGETYSEKTKKISKFFKEEHLKLRKELERPNYFYKAVTDSYHYKNTPIYKTVKKDIKKNLLLYSKLTNELGKKEKIIHLSNDYGQLDFLLTLNSLDRKIIINNLSEEGFKVTKNNYLLNHKKIFFEDTLDKILEIECDTIIINREITEKQIQQVLTKEFSTIIIVNDKVKTGSFLGYKKENDTPFLLRK